MSHYTVLAALDLPELTMENPSPGLVAAQMEN